MVGEKPRITAKVAGRSVYPVLRSFAAGYFLATCACDLLYFLTQSREQRRFTVVEFSEITEWLLAAGLIMAALAGAAALVDFWGEHSFRNLPDLKLFVGGNLLVVALQLYNFHIRYSDGTDAVMPLGLVLSLLAMVVLLCTPSQGWDRMYR